MDETRGASAEKRKADWMAGEKARDWIAGVKTAGMPAEPREKTLAEKLEDRVNFTMTPEAEAQWNAKVEVDMQRIGAEEALSWDAKVEEATKAVRGEIDWPTEQEVEEARTHEEISEKIEGMKVASTGGLRQNVGKLRYDLVPPSWSEALAKVMTRNVEMGVYPARNWEKGLSYQDTLASLERHMIQLKKGEWADQKSGLPHASMIAWNALVLIEFNRRINAGTLPAELDDLPTDHWSY